MFDIRKYLSDAIRQLSGPSVDGNQLRIETSISKTEKNRGTSENATAEQIHWRQNCGVQTRDWRMGETTRDAGRLFVTDVSREGPQKDSVASGTVKHAPLGPVHFFTHPITWMAKEKKLLPKFRLSCQLEKRGLSLSYIQARQLKLPNISRTLAHRYPSYFVKNWPRSAERETDWGERDARNQ